MKYKLEIARRLGLLNSISYQHREGGKYAYVQFLAYARDLLRLLEEGGHYSELIMLRNVCERFNGKLCESLSELHYHEFVRAKEALFSISGLLAGAEEERNVRAA